MSKIDDYLREQARAKAIEEHRNLAREWTRTEQPPVAALGALGQAHGLLDLSERSLEDAIIEIKKLTQDGGEVLRIRTPEDEIRAAAERLVDRAHPTVGNSGLAATLEPYTVWAMTGWDTPRMREILAECFVEDVERWATSMRGGCQHVGGGRPWGWGDETGDKIQELRPIYLYWRRLPTFEAYQPLDSEGRPIAGAAQRVKLSARLLISNELRECGQSASERETCCDWHRERQTSDPFRHREARQPSVILCRGDQIDDARRILKGSGSG